MVCEHAGDEVHAASLPSSKTATDMGSEMTENLYIIDRDNFLDYLLRRSLYIVGQY